LPAIRRPYHTQQLTIVERAFAKDEVCKGAVSSAAAASKTAAADPNGPYKLDAKGKCHDAKGRMAAKTKCAA
jgi:hypothetical protein